MPKETDALDSVDHLILRILGSSKEPVSTYQLAKMSKVSWPTVNMRCYKLKSENLVDGTSRETKLGMKTKVWWVGHKSN